MKAKQTAVFPSAIERFLWQYGALQTMPFDPIARKAVEQFGDAAPTMDEIATFICCAYRGRRNLNRFHRDRAMAAWVLEHCAGRTVDDIRAACLRRFGTARTSSRTRLAEFLQRWGRHWWAAGDRERVEPEIAAWIRREAPHRTVSALWTACVARFGIRRAPSRSALHRHLQRERLESMGKHWRLGADPEAIDWLCKAADELTLTSLSRAMAARFGAERARSRSTIQRHLAKMPNRPRSARLRPLGAVPDIAAWVDERKATHTLDALHASCVATFGADRAPSRSAIHRFISRARL